MPDPQRLKVALPDTRYNPSDVVIHSCQLLLVEVERDIGQVAHSLHELYVNRGIDNRLAKDVLEEARSLISRVKSRLQTS